MPTETDFVPTELDASDWSQIEPLVKDLLDREIDSAAALERWLLERSDLESYIDEVGSRLHVDMTCDTEDEGKSKAFQDFNANVVPPVTKASFELDRKYYNCSYRTELDQGRYLVFDRGVSTDIEIFREENVAIQKELADFRQKHSQITGAQTVEFEGETRTLPAMAKYLEEPDRAIRESAWRAVSDRLMVDRDALRELFDDMFGKRYQIAQNAGLENFRDYTFKMMHRFDYTPDDCKAFQDAVEKHVVPVYRELGHQRAEVLGLSSYRPWDSSVDVRGRGPLDPFDSDVKKMTKGSEVVFNHMDAELGQHFLSLCDGTSLDLDTRIGKAPGGYQTVFSVQRKPFIFMNSLGLGRDLRVLLHEAGHAFHTLYGGNDPLIAYRHAPLEFCEVASMSMELTSMPFLGEVYPNSEDADRARRVQLEGIIRLLPWIAQIDAFQQWMYTHSDHTHEDRQAKWLELDGRFGAGLDWTGLEKYQAESWQRQLHLFLYPFYYIEYGIAQLGAMQVWSNYRKDPAGALASYKRALCLGGSKPLPELFSAADIRFEFGSSIVGNLMGELKEELDKLPL